jgi:hypothetical protein
MKSLGSAGLFEVRESDVRASALCVAVQEVRRDRAGGPGELWQGLRPARRHRRRGRPEQGNDRALSYIVLFLFAFVVPI